MGMMGAMKRIKDEGKGAPKEEKKKEKEKDKVIDVGIGKAGGKTDKEGSEKKTGKAWQAASESASAEAANRKPTVVVEPRKTTPPGMARLAQLTDQIVALKQQKLQLNPSLARGTRRASLPVHNINPLLLAPPVEGQGQDQAEPSQGYLRMRRKSTALTLRRKSFQNVPEEEEVSDPLECLFPPYTEDMEYMNVHVSRCERTLMYSQTICIGLILGVSLALILKLCEVIAVNMYRRIPP